MGRQVRAGPRLEGGGSNAELRDDPQIWLKPGHIWATLREFRRIRAGLDQIQARPEQTLDKARSHVGRVRPNLGRVRTNLERGRPVVARFRPDSG